MVVFAPAGSGKTERLSRRYIELLEAGVKPERILTLTFTEKAAAEMKERIFDRLRAHNPELYRRLLDDVLKLRISTIHSFCLSLVKRFAPLLGLDPRVDVLADSGSLWDNAKYDTLMQVAETERNSEDYASLMDLVTHDRTQGWSRLSGLFDAFFGKRVAVLRARMLAPDLSTLEALADSLKACPVGKEKFPDYRRLFPKQYSPDAIADAARLLEDNATVFMTTGGTPRIRGCSEEEQAWNGQMVEFSNLVRVANWNVEFGRSFELFRKRFLETYTQAKREAGQVDYDDMEFLALKLLHEEAEWQNILYAFDEHTDHILVDEFQDTSFLQWGIIDKLTEEWRAGEGAKTDRDVSPTIFIVGDEKQSIYMFRDAKVEVFAAAADKLELWLGKDKLERITLEDNYRSLQALIDFNNALFSKLMSPTSQTGPTSPTPWMTRYASFTRARKNTAPGKVEIILDKLDDNVAPRRQREAAIIAKRIRALVASPSPQSSPPRGEEAGIPSPLKGEGKSEGGVIVFDRNPVPDGPEIARPCEYRDIAILIRSRTHLPVIEDALLGADIPFMVLGGTGFYSEPETRYLTSLLSFLVDPTDDVALYVTLRGPFFGIEERALFFANQGGLSPNGDCPQSFLSDRIRTHAQPDTPLHAARTALDGWLSQVHRVPLSRILEQALTERGAWAKLWEPQREANVRKFISIIEGWETSGDHPLRILRQLEQAGANEPKADVRTEGRNAVQIITVHSAKGLQFPVVFLPGLDDKIRSANSSGDRLVIEEIAADDVLVSYIPDAGIRRTNEFHQRYVMKEYEEEKRIFYVACTRARDALFLTGICNGTVPARGLSPEFQDTRLTWLVELLGLHEEGDGFALEPELPGTTCITPADIPEVSIPAPTARDAEPVLPVRQSSIVNRQSSIPVIRAVTRHTPKDHAAFDHESIGLGEVIHRLLEEISNGTLTANGSQLTAEIHRLLRLAGLDLSFSANLQSAICNLQSEIAVWDIVQPRPGSFAELPITYSDGTTIFTGRIDRLIVTDTEVRIYDYKTFKVAKKDIPLLAREYYDGQLKHYEAACSRLYPGKKVSTFLIFTALPEVVQTS
ncbi:MAG: UvrD-helicase domain-containing protein [candidate division WOR-3 bacterium]|nr:UvrD-helicase domain-containing protein [candidate division WOR-3 bacterium]